MKMVRAGMIDGKPRLEWREGWSNKYNCWHDDVGDVNTDWHELYVRKGIGLDGLIEYIHSAIAENPEFNRLGVQTPLIPLCFKPVIELLAKELEECLNVWQTILLEVAHVTADGELQMFAMDRMKDAGGVHGKLKERNTQKAKASHRGIKRGKTLREKLPSDDQITRAWDAAYAKLGGRWVHGNQKAKESFFIDIRNRVDDYRREEGQIEMKEYWDVTWQHVYNRCSKLGLLKRK